MYNTTLKLQKRRKHRFYAAGVLLILLAAAGGVLYRLPVPLQDISRIIQLAAGKFSLSPADDMSAGDVLRGTIYDRNFKELAVSYQLFSLYVHPAKIANYSEIAASLSEITAIPKQTIEARLKETKRVIELTDDLDAAQVKAIEQLQLDGVRCKSTEARFYPEHTAAAHVIGYTGGGVGLSGAERRYDLMLQPGEYKAADVPEVDFKENTVLGRQGTDLILTLDMELQKNVDAHLQRLLRDQDASTGVALLLDPVSGRVLALSSRPSFNPNYFWQAGNSTRQNRVYSKIFDIDLIRSLLVRAAARINTGRQTTPLLPVTIAAKDFGLTRKTYTEAVDTFCLLQPVPENLSPHGNQQEGLPVKVGEERLSVMQLGIGIASLMNGGRRLSPLFLDSIYDVGNKHRFSLRREATASTHILSPAMGVLVRQELSSYLASLSKDKTLSYAGKSARVIFGEKMSRYVQQQLFVGMIPRKKPEMLLVMAIEQDHIGPVRKRKKRNSMYGEGKSLLADLYNTARREQLAEHPTKKNDKNLAQFLISRRLDYTPSPVQRTGDAMAMPRLIGMSLRKGLQQLNRQNLRITVKGSGRIVAQSPDAGERLDNVKSCRLTLESEI
jgi:cell division protein FtsI (penicillin-binding protein 3)